MARRARDVCVTERKRFTLLSPRLFPSPFFFRFPRLNECARSTAGGRVSVRVLRACVVCVRAVRVSTFTTCIVLTELKETRRPVTKFGSLLVAPSVRDPRCRTLLAGTVGTVRLFTLEQLTGLEDVREGEGVHGPFGLTSERKISLVRV